MIEKSESNRDYAEKLTTLMTNNSDMRVIAWISTDGINDDYCCIEGNLGEPHIETIVFGYDDMYHSKEDDPLEDCYNYYGPDCDDWSDEELEEKARAIPWEEVIAIPVGV